MSGTHMAYHPTSPSVSPYCPCPAYPATTRYAMSESGTEIGHVGTRAPYDGLELHITCHDIEVAYDKSGTDVGRGTSSCCGIAMQCPVLTMLLSFAMRCPVLIWAMLPRPCSAMSGTDLGYAATRMGTLRS
eukprot:396835-Rhodomonas_salina.2